MSEIKIVTIQMKIIEQYFLAMLSVMQYKGGPNLFHSVVLQGHPKRPTGRFGKLSVRKALDRLNFRYM